MEVTRKSSPFGAPSRTRVLTALELLSESYPRELARLLRANLSTVQKAVTSLERDGIVAGRTVGRSRLFSIDPRYFAGRELRAFVRRLIEADPTLRERVVQLRRRPRRTGKPL